MDKILKIKPSALVNIIVGGGILFYSLSHSIYKIQPGYNAIKFNKFYGVQNKIIKEGLVLMIPWFEYPIIYDCKLASKSYDVHCGTKGSV